MSQLAGTNAGALSPSPAGTGAAPRAVVGGLEFLGTTSFAPGGTFGGQVVGGLSGLAFDATRGVFVAIADDRSPDARFFTLDVAVADGALTAGDVTVTAVRTLARNDGTPFANLSLDPGASRSPPTARSTSRRRATRAG